MRIDFLFISPPRQKAFSGYLGVFLHTKFRNLASGEV